MNDINTSTIAAIATAQGLGGIGVIRVSGEDSIKICNGVFESVTGVENKLLKAKGYSVHYGKIISDGECIDEAVVTVFKKPHSYTGEDVVEISCHGGLYITRKILDLIIERGASLAEAGEFTKRAFLNGKMGLTEAESVMNIIAANGQSSARAAMRVREGNLHKKVNKVKEKLVELAAKLSAWADYPDEDIVEIDSELIKTCLIDCKNSLEKLLATYKIGRVMQEGVNTVIVGRPNVGKSTLMNLLSGCERSIVTDVPGTTRDIVEEKVMLGDICLRIADTAGIRSTSDKVEQIGVRKAKEKISSADLVLAVFDYSKPLVKEDLDLINLIQSENSIAIINKIDLEQKVDVSYLSKNVKNAVKISAVEGQGLKELSNAVNDVIGFAKIDPAETILTTERQKFSIKNALDCVIEAIEVLESGITFDAVTVVVEAAIENLMELTGEHVNEKVLDKVFSTFCVGK